MLIGLHGFPGAGKDTVARLLADAGYSRIAFADKLREALLGLNPVVIVEGGRGVRLAPLVKAHGWDVLKRRVPEVRELLQRLGTEAGRNIHGEDVWVRLALWHVLPEDNVVITDCRFPHEFAAIRARGGVMVNVVRPDCGPVNDHVSERALPCDYTIHTDGKHIEPLQAAVSHLLWWLDHREV